MKPTKQEVERLAEISRLRLTESEITASIAHLARVAERCAIFDCMDIADVPQTAHVLTEVNRFREDKVGQPAARAALMANAPQTDGGAFVVPAVLE